MVNVLNNGRVDDRLRVVVVPSSVDGDERPLGSDRARRIAPIPINIADRRLPRRNDSVGDLVALRVPTGELFFPQHAPQDIPGAPGPVDLTVALEPDNLQRTIRDVAYLRPVIVHVSERRPIQQAAGRRFVNNRKRRGSRHRTPEAPGPARATRGDEAYRAQQVQCPGCGSSHDLAL